MTVSEGRRRPKKLSAETKWEIYLQVAGGEITQTARQLAGAIGVAILVAILGASASGSPTVGTFRWAFAYLASAAVLASLVATRLPARVSAA